MKASNILNATQLCSHLGISYAYLNQLIKQGCPYHQLVPNGRKYYLLPEVIRWVESR